MKFAKLILAAGAVILCAAFVLRLFLMPAAYPPEAQNAATVGVIL